MVFCKEIAFERDAPASGADDHTMGTVELARGYHVYNVAQCNVMPDHLKLKLRNAGRFADNAIKSTAAYSNDCAL